MKVTKFDKETCVKVNAIVMAALKEAGIEGVNFAYRGGKFSDSSFTMKIEAIVEGGVSIKDDRNLNNLKFYAPMDSVDITKKSAIPGESGEYELIGYNTRAPKYPYIVSNGKTGPRSRLKLPTALVQKLFGEAA